MNINSDWNFFEEEEDIFPLVNSEDNKSNLELTEKENNAMNYTEPAQNLKHSVEVQEKMKDINSISC